MEYTIWDKKESINGVPAKKVLESNPHWVDADLILIIENGRITRIEELTRTLAVTSLMETTA
ncbi:hypothetical protein ERICIV_00899 [Paenibacillus larvae subsp. larvae]|uniref:Uncharacterized protein n=1 Tax=Paenibacillus larvae subsp. larvae TaxID=147375 RepID=A0A2L1TWP4_9BACL|nr:hypothetical protein [Paenibacillus larvae]AQT85701.1 hypothetical protein B1222_16855 [Paenibacillus larvae subsp. pulvifaciens]AVF25103.1 hypothetical protein ERICIII_00896 [Paenibacillus larvae subsp. larvae]AVF29867.1 hypothetical protein ERICIV_00899 [Paenibacillus larvae subsp. larvae]MBH0342265.1 hypothetical protein [Paenibacillus larvae]MCY9500203.1 hypothetical protein [Paenibacillus larvae]